MSDCSEVLPQVSEAVVEFDASERLTGYLRGVALAVNTQPAPSQRRRCY